MGKLNFNVVGAGNEMFFVFKNNHRKLWLIEHRKEKSREETQSKHG